MSKPRGRTTSGRSRTVRSQPSQRGRVYPRDFDKVRPRKLLPGVVGRSQWFAERAGAQEDALSLERLRRGISDAENMRELGALRAEVIDEAHALLDDTTKATRKRVLRGPTPTLVDLAGRPHAPTAIRTRKRHGIAALSRPLKVEDEGFLFVPVEEGTAAHLDLEAVVVAEISDPMQPRLNQTFTYWPQEKVLVGRITRAGRYQAFALPKDPWIRTTFDTLARHWKWVERDPSLREMMGRRGSKSQPGIVDRICQLILCAPDYDQVKDAQAFEGIGMPPRELPAIGNFEGGDVCERCLSRFLGEIEVVDGALVKPPVIKWWWDFFPRCSRWRSVGPAPGLFNFPPWPFPRRAFRGIGRVSQIDIHPTDGNILIAGAAGGGVWRTGTGGGFWLPSMDLQPTLTIGAVAIARSNPSIMYAASGEDGGPYLNGWSGVGIYRTDNGGSNWTLMTGVPSTRFSAIVVHPKNPDVIYVAGNRGLHKSVNGGATWRTNPGLQSLFDGQITDVVLGYEEPVVVETEALEAPPLGGFGLVPPFNERVYIGVRDDGVYRSITAGEQFVGATPAFTRLDVTGQLPSGSAAGWTKLAIGRRGTHRSRFLAAKLGPDGSQIFTTIDAGTTWTEQAADVAKAKIDEWCSVIAVDPTDENVMYAGADDELKRTTNGGATTADWTSINTGVHADQQDIAFDPQDSKRIFLANDGGIYRSSNRGTDWTFASGTLAITQFYDIDISERDRDIIAGGAQDNGIYYRNASGTWRNIPWGDGTQVAVDPTDPQIFYFSSQNGLPTYLERSVDGGASHQPLGQAGLSGSSPWITIIKLEPRDPIADPADNRVVFVCSTNELFRSSDGGQTWSRVEDGSGVPFQTDAEITALEFAPSDPAILYLATSSGAVYRAVNGGVTTGDWTRIDTPGSPADALFPSSGVQAIRVNPDNSNHVWLVFGGSGVSFTARPDMILNPLGISHLFRNTNAPDINGWEDASGQFPALSLPDVPTSAAALVDFDPLVAFAGTDVGAFRTTDGGATWTAFQDGLPRSPVVELRFNRPFKRLFAATMGRGVWIRDV
jgi:photosystem II stability/assembly factor-like uncharacterized protein